MAEVNAVMQRELKFGFLMERAELVRCWGLGGGCYLSNGHTTF
jgi:hypothetical protein